MPVGLLVGSFSPDKLCFLLSMRVRGMPRAHPCLQARAWACAAVPSTAIRVGASRMPAAAASWARGACRCAAAPPHRALRALNDPNICALLTRPPSEGRRQAWHMCWVGGSMRLGAPPQPPGGASCVPCVSCMGARGAALLMMCGSLLRPGRASRRRKGRAPHTCHEPACLCARPR